MPSSKTKCQRLHLKNRVEERFGIAINRIQQEQLVDKIQRGGSDTVRFLDRQSNRITRWTTVIADKPAILVYDKQRKTIVTVLDPKLGLRTSDMVDPLLTLHTVLPDAQDKGLDGEKLAWKAKIAHQLITTHQQEKEKNRQRVQILLQQAEKRGEANGRADAIRQIAERLLRSGLPPSTVVGLTNLRLDTEPEQVVDCASRTEENL